MDDFDYWRDVLIECIEAEQDFFMLLEFRQFEKFAGFFLSCYTPSSQTEPLSEIEEEILRYIFQIVYRASCGVPEMSFSPTPSFLIDFAKVYGVANPEVVNDVISKFISAYSGLETDFICARSSMVDYMKSVVKKLEKTGYNKVGASYNAFVLGLFANIGLGLSNTFSSSTQICNWFNLTPDFLTTSMNFYDSATQLILLSPISFENSIKEKFLSVIQLSLNAKYFSPIKNFGTSPATRVNLFDQVYIILSKRFSPENEYQPRRALYDAPLVADLSMTYDYPSLLAGLDSPDIACRKTKLDSLISLFETSLFGLQRAPSPPPSYHSTTDVESDDDALIVAKVSQVRDIFPDLTESFVKLCFEQLSISAEGLISQLLEDNLPPELKAKRDQGDNNESILATRRNIHDNDEFDLLAPGRKKAPLEGVYQKEELATVASIRPQDDLKASTIQLVYNQYEDEYDDTYDQDIQGPAEPGDTPSDPSLKHEAVLYSAYSDNPDLFQKSKESRASKARANLRILTGMSDEQLEGWASMLKREPSRQKRLGATHGIATETIDNHKQPISEKPQPAPTQINKSYKDRNKAKIGNHRRKDMHQRKLDKA